MRSHFHHCQLIPTTTNNNTKHEADDDNAQDKSKHQKARRIQARRIQALCLDSPCFLVFGFVLCSGFVRTTTQCLLFSSSIRNDVQCTFTAVPFVLLALISRAWNCHLVGFARPQSEHSAIGPHQCSNCVDGLFAERGRIGKRGERRNSCHSRCKHCYNRRWRSHGQADG